MSALLTNPVVLAIGAAFIAVIVGLFKGNLSGAAKERAKQAEAEQKARDISEQVQNDVGALPPNEAREEMKRWSR